MENNNITIRLPPHKRISFDESETYQVNGTTAVVQRTFVLNKGENVKDIIERLIKLEIINS